MSERDASVTDESIEREFEALATALRADAPRPSDRLERDLSERVRAGFPRRRSRLRLPALRRPPKAAVAGAASLACAAVVAVAVVGSDGGPDDPRGGAQSLQTQPAPGGGGSVEAVPPGGGGDFAPGERRRVERLAALVLAAPADRLDRVADGVATVTDRYRGYVLRSSFATGDDAPNGSFELRIPARSLQPALRDLAELGEVRSRTQSGVDVTRQFTSAAERLEGARAERRSLLRRLERAGSDAEAEALRRRLDLNAGEVRGLRGQVRELRARTDYAAVSVTLERDGADGGGGGQGDDGLGGALDDALGSLEESVEIAVRVLGVAIPLALLAALAWVAARVARRRRREAALS